jgi:hypothetical protein
MTPLENRVLAIYAKDLFLQRFYPLIDTKKKAPVRGL